MTIGTLLNDKEWVFTDSVYDIFINVTTKVFAGSGESWSENTWITKSIKMVRCNSLDNPLFFEGGRIYDDVFAKSFEWSEGWLCPEHGNLEYKGKHGTNLWVVPKPNIFRNETSEYKKWFASN
jgi:hypothetical protein